MSNAEEYLKFAQECREQAGKARNSLDKEEWLKIAEEWLRLATQATFDRGPRP